MRDNFLLEAQRVFKVPSSSCWLSQARRNLVLMASYVSIRWKGNGILMAAPQWFHCQSLSLSACSGAVGVMPELLGRMHISVTHNAGSSQGTGQGLLALTLPPQLYSTDLFLVFLSSLLLSPASPLLTLLTTPSCPASRKSSLFYCALG